METLLTILFRNKLSVTMYQRMSGEFLCEITDGHTIWSGIDNCLMGWAVSKAFEMWESDHV